MADSGYDLSFESVGNIVRSIDTNSDAMVDEGEFKELIAGLFVIIRDIQRTTLRQIEHESAELGARVTALSHAEWHKRHSYKVVVPWGWSRSTDGKQLVSFSDMIKFDDHDPSVAV